MCIAVAIPKEMVLNKDTLKHCWDQNPDGGGVMYSDGKRIRIYKVLDDYKKFEKLYYRLANGPARGKNMVVHCRVATHGAVNRRNCHPHKINSKLGFVHNGTIHNVVADKTKGDSDTVVFRNEILRNLGNSWRNEGVFTMMEKFIGKSKLVFLDVNDLIKIANEDLGEWDSGVWFSNDTYRLPRRKKTTTTTGYGSNYGNQGGHDKGLINGHHSGKNTPVIAGEEHFDNVTLEWKPQRFISKIPQGTGTRWLFDSTKRMFYPASDEQAKVRWDLVTEDQIYNIQCGTSAPEDKGRGMMKGWCKRYNGSWRTIKGLTATPVKVWAELNKEWEDFIGEYDKTMNKGHRWPCDGCGIKLYKGEQIIRGTCYTCQRDGISPAATVPKKDAVVVLPPTFDEIQVAMIPKNTTVGGAQVYVSELMGWFRKAWVTARYPNGVHAPLNYDKRLEAYNTKLITGGSKQSTALVNGKPFEEKRSVENLMNDEDWQDYVDNRKAKVRREARNVAILNGDYTGAHTYD